MSIQLHLAEPSQNGAYVALKEKLNKEQRIKRRRRERWNKMMAFGKDPKRTTTSQLEAFGSKPHKANSESMSFKASDGLLEPKEQPSGGKKNVISSLFTHNPEIPNLPSSNIAASIRPAESVTDGSFQSLGIDMDVCVHLEKKMNITKPTPIQSISLPRLLNHKNYSRDAIIRAQTGSGKTLAYMLPILQRLLAFTAEQSSPPSRNTFGTLAIVLLPTRELCAQVSQCISQLLIFKSSKFKHWMVSGHITGGDNRSSEKARLRAGVTILCATPGRCLDHLKNTKSWDTSHTSWLVLDEADRLLELGFKDTLQEIVEELNQRRDKSKIQGLPTRRQIILCSATVNDRVKEVVGNTMTNPLLIHTENNSKTTFLAANDEKEYQMDELVAPPQQLKQNFIVMPTKLRLVVLIGLLRSLLQCSSAENPSKIIVFYSCCDSVDFHHHLFTNVSQEGQNDNASSVESDDDGLLTQNVAKIGDNKMSAEYLLPDAKVLRIHGSLQQRDRNEAYQCFREKQSTRPLVLFSTDVAARGLDLPGVTHIIQYDPPTDMKEYVHRVGRTARMGATGDAYLMLLPHEVAYEQRIRNFMGSNKISFLGSRYEDVLQSAFGKHWDSSATDIQLACERFVLKNKQATKLARDAFRGHIRAYATHSKENKDMFHPKLLHTGHLAKCFALREPPSGITMNEKRNVLKEKSMMKFDAKNPKVPIKKGGIGLMSVKRLATDVSEFAIFDASKTPVDFKKRKI